MDWREKGDVISALEECVGCFEEGVQEKEKETLLENTVVAVKALLAIIGEEER